MTRKAVWISFDLGLRGDYEGLYAWLDERKAKECGESLAFLSCDFDELDATNSVPMKLEAEIKKNVKTDKRTRIYVIYRDTATGRNKGKFIFGGRRAPVWTGHAPSTSNSADDEA